MAMAKFTCIVKWFSNLKGYGFITPNKEGMKEQFVHQSSIISSHSSGTFIKENKANFLIESGEDDNSHAISVISPKGAPVRSKKNTRRGAPPRGNVYSNGAKSNVFHGQCDYYHVIGHMVKDCSEKNKCYRCKEEGHFARDCFNPAAGEDYIGNGNCYSCGDPVHFDRECPSS